MKKKDQLVPIKGDRFNFTSEANQIKAERVNQINEQSSMSNSNQTSEQNRKQGSQENRKQGSQENRNSNRRQNRGQRPNQNSNQSSRLGRNRNTKRSRNRRNARQRKVAQLPKGVVNLQCTFNNTIITFTNITGKVMGWVSAGVAGFKGARKSTAFAAKTAAGLAARKSIDKGLKRTKVMIKGPGPGRDNALRGLLEAGLEMAVVRDVTGLPHNGCRPRKKRRV